MKRLHAEEEAVEVPSSGGRLWVNSFTEPAARAFADAVFAAAEQDPNKPIVCYIDSYGGNIDGLTTMLSAIDSVPNPFVTIATGKAMSAGAVLLSHGDIRCVGQHARVMIHQASGAVFGHIDDVNTDANELKRINEAMLEILARNCGKTLATLKKSLSEERDVYLTPQQAVDFGIADNVGIPIVAKRTTFDLVFSVPAPVPERKTKKKAKKKGKR